MRPIVWLHAAALALALLFGGPAAAQSFTAPPPELTLQAGWEPTGVPDGWVERSRPGLVMHGHVDDLDLLDELAEHAVASVPKIARTLDVPIGDTIRILLPRSPEEFRALQPGQPPLWADGTAYAELGAIFLRHPDVRGGLARPLTQVLDHELVHILLGRAYAPGRPPRWLQEGTAQVLAGEAGPATTERLSRGLMLRAPFALDDLARGFPTDAHAADLAYAQSADFVQWLQATTQPDAIAVLVRETRRGGSLAEAVRALTGESLADVDARWRARLVQTTPTWTAPSNLDGLLLGAGALLLLAGGAWRVRARAKRFGQWREDRGRIQQLAREVLARRRDP